MSYRYNEMSICRTNDFDVYQFSILGVSIMGVSNLHLSFPWYNNRRGFYKTGIISLSDTCGMKSKYDMYFGDRYENGIYVYLDKKQSSSVSLFSMLNSIDIHTIKNYTQIFNPPPQRRLRIGKILKRIQVQHKPPIHQYHGLVRKNPYIYCKIKLWMDWDTTELKTTVVYLEETIKKIKHHSSR